MQPSTASHEFPPRADRRKDSLGVLLHEQHRRNDDVGLRDRVEATLQRRRIVPVRGGVEGEVQPRNVPRQFAACAIHRPREMVVEGDDDEARTRALSGRSGLWLHKGCLW